MTKLVIPDAQWAMLAKPHDFIHLTFRNYDEYLVQVAELYIKTLLAAILKYRLRS